MAGRRAQGTGSVGQRTVRGIKRWYWRLPGSREEHLTPANDNTKRRATEELNRAIREARHRPKARTTVADFLDRWLAQMIAPPAHPRGTWVGYRNHIEKRIKPTIGSVILADLTPGDIQAAVTSWRTDHEPSTIRVCKNMLSAALQAAEDWGELGRNPAPRVRLPRTTAKPPAAMKPETARALLEAFRDHPLDGVVALALSYGLRESEILGLRWEDVSEGMVAVAGQLDRHTQEYQPRRKAGGELHLPVTPLVADALARQRAKQADDRRRAGWRWRDGGFIFTRADGAPISQSQLVKWWSARLEQAGLPPMRFHDTRHGAGSLYAALGIHPRVSMEILGHTSPDTHRRYQHIAPEVLKAELERHDRALRDGKVDKRVDGGDFEADA